MTIRLMNGAYIADTARVIGRVTLGAGASVWYGAVIRGDVAPVSIGAMTNVQDNAVIHCDFRFPNRIGARVTIGHGAIIHGEEVGDGSLIGMGAVLLGHSRIGPNCLIAAGAVVPPGMVVAEGTMVMGVGAKVTRPLTDQEREYMKWLPEHYEKLARRHVERPDDPVVFEEDRP